MKRDKSVDFTGYWLAMETLGPQSSVNGGENPGQRGGVKADQ
jgi:hypothetical protein